MKNINIPLLMKKILLILLLLPLISKSQNPFDRRTNKSPKGVALSFDYEIIDGRLSDKEGFLAPQQFANPQVFEPQEIKYKLKYDPSQGLPIWLDIIQKEQPSGLGVSTFDESLMPAQVLKDLPGIFQWNENAQLKQLSVATDHLGVSHTRYYQTYKGIKVKGGEWLLHSKSNQVLFGNGRVFPSFECNVIPDINEQTALLLALNHGHKLHSKTEHSNTFTAFDSKPTIELFIDYNLQPELKPQLVYIAEIRPTNMHHYKVWIDAKTGDILKTLDLLCSIDGPKTATSTDLNNVSRTINTYQLGSTYYLIDASRDMYKSGQSSLPDDPVGAIWTIDAQNTDAESFAHVSSGNNTWSDKSAVSAHHNAGVSYEYFKNTHNRNSINGSGGTIISVVNVTRDGSSMENAYWNGQAMFYGNGGFRFEPLAGALDVAGHELTHGVVSNTANLEYESQSGAINESMADIFGAMIDRDDWQMGEDITKTSYISTGALRDLKDPHNGGNSLSDAGYQPEKMSEYYQGQQDNQGVHINSGIVNKAYYLIATDISKEKAEKIYYRALDIYLTSISKFLDLRYAVVQAATDLYGSTEVEAIKSAFDFVQIFDPNAGSGSSGNGGGGVELPVNPGTENIISVDNNSNDPNTFYKSSTAPDNFQALSQNVPKRRCSVTDNGEIMYYVSSSNTLYSVSLQSTTNEQAISNDDWDNVAVSKDGNLLALISTEVDSSIWVYNFGTSEWKSFKLYNPTYTEGVETGNVLYADQIEFDNTGQYVLYDARNIIEGANGNDIDYWDVGIIRVWDQENTTWGDGKVEKLFTQLPDNVSIGNATYAKNSPYIIAFDYINGNSNSISVIGHNTITNTSSTIFTQSKLGFPNFSNKDDKIIFDANSTVGDPVIAIRDLASNKISPKTGSNALLLIDDAQWGVWYANGTRNLLSTEKELLTFSFPALESKPEGVINGTDINIAVPSGTDVTDLTPTFTHSPEATVWVSSNEQISGVSAQNFSLPRTYRVIAQDGSSKNFVVRVNEAASIEEYNNAVYVYPNPASNELRIKTKHQIESVSCYNLEGKEIFETKNQEVLDISMLKNGIYYLRIKTDKGYSIKRFSKL